MEYLELENKIDYTDFGYATRLIHFFSFLSKFFSYLSQLFSKAKPSNSLDYFLIPLHFLFFFLSILSFYFLSFDTHSFLARYTWRNLFIYPKRFTEELDILIHYRLDMV
jgi:hypothetical protein